MFNFAVRYLGILKHVPGLALVFDVWLKALTLLTNPALLDWMDEIEQEVRQWPAVSKTMHKYGGVQFNFNNIEIGHIHGNGLLDILLNRSLKRQLMVDGKIQHHHIFKDAGWISFFIKTEADKVYALKLIRMGYALKSNKVLKAPGSNNQTALPAIVAVFAEVNTLPNAKRQFAVTDRYGYRSPQ